MMAAVVAAMTLGELLGPAAGSHAELSVTDLVSDSRDVTDGAAFVALAGGRSHGLEFADRARHAGAAIILYDPRDAAKAPAQASLAVDDLSNRLGELGRRFFGSQHLPDGLIGVTGTNGKTTVTWLIAQALTTLGESCGYIGTIGYGLPDKLKPQALTTPDCLALHRAIAEIGASTAAIEVSSHAIAQDRIAGLGFDVAVFTNLSQDHLDWHGTMDAYFETKAGLFEREELGAAVINRNDAYAQSLASRLAARVRALFVAVDTNADADIAVRFDSDGLSGMRLHVSSGQHKITIRSKLIGSFNAENLVLALGALVARGHDLYAAADALAAANAPAGRMEVFGGPPDKPWVIVDYAHTPVALERVLGAASALQPGKIICVFGCGGDRDREKRALMGRAAATHADRILLTDDNPRSEDPAAIVADIKKGTTGHSDVRVEHDREQAIAAALAGTSAGDIVVVAGRGHETRQLYGSESRPLDDRAVVRRFVEGIS